MPPPVFLLIQELEHQKGILANDLQEAKNNWISKAFTSLRTSSGVHSISIHREGGAPAAGWNLHGGSLSAWSAKKLSWPHRENRDNVWTLTTVDDVVMHNMCSVPQLLCVGLCTRGRSPAQRESGGRVPESTSSCWQTCTLLPAHHFYTYCTHWLTSSVHL